MKRLIPLLLAIALVVAACGDDADPAAQASEDGSTDVSTTETSGNQPATEAPTTTIDPIAAEYGSPVVSGDPLPPYSNPDPASGVAAPIVVGADYDGSEVTIGGNGAPHAAMFLAHWCPHCQTELPMVTAWLEETGGVDGVAIVAVSVGAMPERDNWPPSEWFADEGWPGPVLLDDIDSSAFRAFGGQSIPFWVFVDADGTVVSRIEGAADIASVEAALQSISP